MRRCKRAVLAVAFLTLAGAPAHAAAFDSPAAAQRAVLEDVGSLSQEERHEAKRLIENRLRESPRDVQALRALARLCEATGDWDAGLPAARALVKEAPDIADHHYLLGTALFATIDEVSFLNKGARAKAGREAYERAVEIDPSHLQARIGLVNFFMEAPGFAGGNKEKAERIARDLVAEPEHARIAYPLLLEVLAKREKWDEFHLAGAEAAELLDTPEQIEPVLRAAVYYTLFTAEDWERGLELARRYREVQEEGSFNADFFEGSALFELERFAEAAERFERVIEIQPSARNSRWRLAECCQELGQDADAARHYASFAEQFPEDDRASRADRLARRLR